MTKALTITISYRNDHSKGGDKVYLIRHNVNGVEETKRIETTPQRNGMGADDWLEEALNWAYQLGIATHSKNIGIDLGSKPSTSAVSWWKMGPKGAPQLIKEDVHE